jgi:dethiobiotin synthetase
MESRGQVVAGAINSQLRTLNYDYPHTQWIGVKAKRQSTAAFSRACGTVAPPKGLNEFRQVLECPDASGCSAAFHAGELPMPRTIFITGTDTGVGKTVLAASLLHYLRQTGVRALGMKPFCSGGREDAELIQSMQPGELADDEVNPFYFPEAVAPLVSARKHDRRITLAETMRRLRGVQRKCDVLIVEGSGGLLVPLGKKLMVADVIRALKCEVVIVARNRLGTINHTLLTVGTAKRLRPKQIKVVLMDGGERDASTSTNLKILRELLAPIRVVEYPFLGKKGASLQGFRGKRKILEKVLARVLE